MRKTRRLYVAVRPNGWRALMRSEAAPTAETHPDFAYAIGPFRTVAGAHVCQSNVGVITVAECERRARRMG